MGAIKTIRNMEVNNTMKNPWEIFGITESTYNDIVAPYRVIIKELLVNQPAKILASEEIAEELKRIEDGK